MSVETNKQLVREFFDRAFVEHDLDAAVELVASDYSLHDPLRPDFEGGPEAFARAQRAYETAITRGTA